MLDRLRFRRRWDRATSEGRMGTSRPSAWSRAAAHRSFVGGGMEIPGGPPAPKPRGQVTLWKLGVCDPPSIEEG